jgi:hypothetical protein
VLDVERVRVLRSDAVLLVKNGKSVESIGADEIVVDGPGILAKAVVEASCLSVSSKTWYSDSVTKTYRR